MLAPMETPALLLIGHGTRNPAAADEAAALCDALRARLGVPVGCGWIEWDLLEPQPAVAAARLRDEGATALVTLPLLAFAAGHAKTDVPGELAAISEAVPELERWHGTVLGQHPRLFDLARRRIDAARAAAGLTAVDTDEALLVTGPGTSDPDANGELAKAARFLADTTDFRWSEIAVAGVTWPTADEALRRLTRAGSPRVTRFSWSLLAGTLEQRVDARVEEVTAETGVGVIDAGRFGPEAELVDAAVDRYHEAWRGRAAANCELCQFRLPLPGRENRAGLPSAGGTGEAVHPRAQAIQATRDGGGDPTDWKNA
jgi:sirohydrochlorin ferrochelatase